MYDVLLLKVLVPRGFCLLIYACAITMLFDDVVLRVCVCVCVCV